MNPVDKDKIRQALSHACGHDVGEVHPEFFLSATVGGAKLFPMLVKTEINTAVMLGVFLHRDLPEEGKRGCFPIWQFGMN